MKKLIHYYNFIVVSFFVLAGFVSATSFGEIVIASVFFPLFVYFAALVFPKPKKAIVHPKNESLKPVKESKNEEKVEKLAKIDEGKVDIDRRAFLKLIGSAGGAMFIFSIFGVKKAQAAFFGSVPGPGVVALKDSSGNQIDPAEEHPTDGYQISRVDDGTPSYYGFTKVDGSWYIIKEESSGNYTYAVGSSDFSSNWSNHDQSPPTGPTYQEYSDAFS